MPKEKSKTKEVSRLAELCYLNAHLDALYHKLDLLIEEIRKNNYSQVKQRVDELDDAFKAFLEEWKNYGLHF